MAIFKLTATGLSTGGVLFGLSDGTIGQDAAKLFWDNTAKRLAIGGTGPASTFDVKGLYDVGAIFIGPSSVRLGPKPDQGSPRIYNLNTDDLTLDGDNFGFNTESFGSGSKVIGVGNAAANPTTNPASGGILYADGGAGKWRGSSGTVTTFGPAEPHCPKCGRDFVLEWKNKKYGHLIVCVWCLTAAARRGVALRRPGGKRSR